MVTRHYAVKHNSSFMSQPSCVLSSIHLSFHPSNLTLQDAGELTHMHARTHAPTHRPRWSFKSRALSQKWHARWYPSQAALKAERRRWKREGERRTHRGGWRPERGLIKAAKQTKERRGFATTSFSLTSISFFVLKSVTHKARRQNTHHFAFTQQRWQNPAGLPCIVTCVSGLERRSSAASASSSLHCSAQYELK